ncbi:hypothetical protein [Candidatus Hakubella thermalkaliphila]|uniref:hypothetical protein n=1 Tax=Candidatus Hakubella thermalkaliphila TaxID=2754717 RepID=UPI001593A117|nr:hypothetical protein [Candidatus Hakubella thermalkaliphila]
MGKMLKEGRIFITENGFPRYKRYLEEMEGVTPQSIWADKEVWTIGSWFSEKIEYPTQKPINLMKRILQITHAAQRTTSHENWLFSREFLQMRLIL